MQGGVRVILMMTETPESSHIPFTFTFPVINTVHCSYKVDFSEGPTVRCVKYYVNSAICENLGLDYVLMPSVWSSPDQRYADNLLDVLGDLVNFLQV